MRRILIVDDMLAEVAGVADAQVLVERALVADVGGHRHGRRDVLGQLRATNNWFTIGRETVFGDAPVTELGKVEAEWLATR